MKNLFAIFALTIVPATCILGSVWIGEFAIKVGAPEWVGPTLAMIFGLLTITLSIKGGLAYINTSDVDIDRVSLVYHLNYLDGLVDRDEENKPIDRFDLMHDSKQWRQLSENDPLAARILLELHGFLEPKFNVYDMIKIKSNRNQLRKMSESLLERVPDI